MPLLLAGSIWGFAEASLFFIVPDVLLSWVVINQPRKTAVVMIATLAGALVGGCLLYYWGMQNQQQLLMLLDAIPAISQPQMNSVAAALSDNAFPGMLSGSFSGTPYKLYAAQAASSGISLTALMLLSIPARLSRWIIIVLLSYAAKQALLHFGYTQVHNKIWLMLWLAFYLVYFSVMPG